MDVQNKENVGTEIDEIAPFASGNDHRGDARGKDVARDRRSYGGDRSRPRE